MTERKDDTNVNFVARVTQRLIPIVGQAKMGPGGFFEVFHDGDGYVEGVSSDPKAYALRVVGESMLPRIKPGEYVVCEPMRQVCGGDEVALRTREGEWMVKTFLYEREGLVHLESINNGEKRSISIKNIEVSHFVSNIIKPSKAVDPM